ncbi:hypothetical protein [Gulosibacter sp. 10]|uniref:hypothetical protein n=1 Tax=Gulosibacter sp. 10 TaxID=1255570 RepID=UPI00097E9A69|nr:hypothetical protein [Gulosibacter sp. 10]SJM60924.1 hypothetical protein FM112_07460 [Gulosibacter sp. 10]
MNATNRGVNRSILLTVGAMLLISGGAALVVVLWAPAGSVWTAGTGAAVDWLRETQIDTRIADSTTLSWLALALLALLLIVVVIAVVVIARLGGGGSSRVVHVEAEEAPYGSVTVRARFASDAIADALAGRDEILASRTRVRRVRDTNVLHVSVTPRLNTSPVDVADTVAQLVGNLETLMGQDVPACISVHSGIRSRVAPERSRVD